MKLCPVCRTQAPIDAQACLGCGHQYRTQFAPPDQTQAFAAIPQPPVSPQPYGQQVQYPPGFQQPYAQPVPRDEFEWKLQVVWLWALSVAGTFAVYVWARIMASAVSGVPQFLLAFGSPFVGVPALGLLTFCLLRLRRLYRYDAPHRTGWGVTLLVCVALVFSLVVFSEFAIRSGSDERPESDRLP